MDTTKGATAATDNTPENHTPAIVTALAPAKNAFNPESELVARIEPEDLAKAKPAALNIATQYYDFVLGKPVRAVFLGMTTAKTVNQQTSEEVILPAVVFIGRDADHVRKQRGKTGGRIGKSGSQHTRADGLDRHQKDRQRRTNAPV